MDARLEAAIRTIQKPDEWVALATTGRDGWPHAAPMMMGIAGGFLTFSLTGKQKQRNLQRDPRCCVSISRNGDTAHVIVWGTMELRDDDEAQQMWDDLIRTAFGEAGYQKRKRSLKATGTYLGLLTPLRWRILGV